MRRLPVLGLSLLWPADAWAHAPIEGIGNFYAGLLHPLMVPAHLMALLALGLWLAQQDIARKQLATFALFPALCLASTLATLLDWKDRTLPAVLAALVLGILAAAQLRPSASLLLLAVLLSACAIGLDSGLESAGFAAGVVFALGLCITATVVMLSLAVYAARLTREWQRIGLRVAAAWIAAAAAMIGALSLTPQG